MSSVAHFEFVNQGMGVRFLRDTSTKVGGVSFFPMIVGSEEPGNFTHALNLDSGGELFLKPFFDAVRDREVNKIVDVRTNVDWWFIQKQLGYKDTWLMGAGLKTK